MGVFGGQQNKQLTESKVKLYGLINHATGENLSSPNFGLQTDCANIINQSSDPNYLSTKACKELRKRLRVKSSQVQKLTLNLLEALVRSCGEPFHQELASSDLFPEVLRLADNSTWCPPEIQAEALALVQEWAYALKPSVFVNAYNQLKSRGFEFPPRTGNPAGVAGAEAYPGLAAGMAQAQAAQAQALAQAQAAGPQPGGGAGGPWGAPSPGAPGGLGASSPWGGAGAGAGAGAGGAAAAGPGGAAPSSSSANQLLSPSQSPTKLLEDLSVARSTVRLLEEVLDGCRGDAAAARADFVADMADQVVAMKARLAPLAERATDERVLASALDLNDDAQAALDRHAALLNGRGDLPKRARSMRRFQSSGSIAATAGGAGPSTQPQAMPAAPAAPAPAPEVDLLSLDDWAPAPPAPPAPQAPPPSAFAAPAAQAPQAAADAWGADAWGQTTATPAPTQAPAQPTPAWAQAAQPAPATSAAAQAAATSAWGTPAAPAAPAAASSSAWGAQTSFGATSAPAAAPTHSAWGTPTPAPAAPAAASSSAWGAQTSFGATSAPAAPAAAPASAWGTPASAPASAWAAPAAASAPAPSSVASPVSAASPSAPKHSNNPFADPEPDPVTATFGANAYAAPAPLAGSVSAGDVANPFGGATAGAYGAPAPAAAGYQNTSNGYAAYAPPPAAAPPAQDAFGGLVHFPSAQEKAPAPPKGEPMRGGQNNAQGASAFDAFDHL